MTGGGRMETGNKDEKKWYYRTSTLVILVLCVGPFGLPLLWVNPYFSRTSKILISLAVIALSYLLGLVVAQSLKSLWAYYKEVGLL